MAGGLSELVHMSGRGDSIAAWIPISACRAPVCGYRRTRRCISSTRLGRISIVKRWEPRTGGAERTSRRMASVKIGIWRSAVR